MVQLLTIAMTFVATAIFFAFTLHVAARWVLGATPWKQAVVVAPAPAAAVIALGLVDPPTVLQAGGAAVVDLVAIWLVYELRPRTAAILTVAHVLVSFAIAIAARNFALVVFGG